MAISRHLKVPKLGLGVGLFTNCFRPVISGVVNSIDLTRKELLRQGHRPYVFAPRVAGYKGGPAGIFRFPSINFTRMVQFPLPVPFSCRIFRQMPQMGLEVLHTHHPMLLGDLAYVYSRHWKVPLVYTFHTQYDQYSHYVRFHQPTVKALTRWAVLHFTRRCDLVIAPSPMIADYLLEVGVKAWTVTLQNAIDLSHFQSPPAGLRASVRARLGIPLDAVVGVYAGRIGLEKNLDFLIRAFQPVAQSNSKAHLLIVGNGPELPNLMNLSSDLELNHRISFAGRVDYLDMAKYYGCADYFAIASVTEVKPLVVLEAMAAGLPVIAVAACGTADTVTHEKDGLLCPLDEAALTGVLSRVVEEDRTYWSESARATAAQYSIQPYTHKLVDLYREARDRIRSSI